MRGWLRLSLQELVVLLSVHTPSGTGEGKIAEGTQESSMWSFKSWKWCLHFPAPTLLCEETTIVLPQPSFSKLLCNRKVGKGASAPWRVEGCPREVARWLWWTPHHHSTPCGAFHFHSTYRQLFCNLLVNSHHSHLRYHCHISQARKLRRLAFMENTHHYGSMGCFSTL